MSHHHTHSAISHCTGTTKIMDLANITAMRPHHYAGYPNLGSAYSVIFHDASPCPDASLLSSQQSAQDLDTQSAHLSYPHRPRSSVNKHASTSKAWDNTDAAATTLSQPHSSGRSSTSNRHMHSTRDAPTLTEAYLNEYASCNNSQVGPGHGASTSSHTLAQSRSRHNNTDSTKEQSHPCLQTSLSVSVRTSTTSSPNVDLPTNYTRYHVRSETLRDVVDDMAQHMTSTNVLVRVDIKGGMGKNVYVEGARTAPGINSPTSSSSGQALGSGQNHGGRSNWKD